MILLAKHVGAISTWEGTLFQVPLVRGMKLRSRVEHIGRPFTGPDGLVLTIASRSLHGSGNRDLDISSLTAETLSTHPEYKTWLQGTLYAGGAADSTIYARVRSNNTLKSCDAYVNSVPYSPGPLSTPPAAAPGPSSAPASSRKSTPKKGRAASSPKSPRKSASPNCAATKRTSASTMRRSSQESQLVVPASHGDGEVPEAIGDQSPPPTSRPASNLADFDIEGAQHPIYCCMT